MEKWIRPLTEVQKFEANEYVSACGMTESGDYIFTCDAPAGPLYYYTRSGSTEYMGSYHPCGETHKTEGTGNYYKGFIDWNGNRREDEGESVLVWRQYVSYGFLGGGYSGHASASLKAEQVQEVRS